MTREGAINWFEAYLMDYHDPMEVPDDLPYEVAQTALSALRPVSREQVEKVWRGCEMCADWKKLELKPCANGDLGVRADIGSLGEDDPFGLLVYDRYIASGYVDFDFCPFCGAPKTDEAVEMVMERINKLLESGRQE